MALAAIGCILVSMADRRATADDDLRDGRTVMPMGEAVGGLAFSLSADKYETVMNAEGTNAEPIRLKYTFKNVGREPLQLDVWYPVTSAMRFHVVEPDGARMTFRLFVPYKKRERRTASDLVRLEPDKTYELDRETHIGFPMSGKRAPNEAGKQGGTHWTYQISAPGRYKIRATFRRSDDSWVRDDDKVWTGEVTSNDIVLVVRQRRER